MNLDLESYIKQIETIIKQKEKNIKNWDDFYPSFLSLSKNNLDLIKKNSMEEDIKKLLSFIKPLGVLDNERRIKRLSSFKKALIKLKEKYLIDEFDLSESNYSLFTDIKYVKTVGSKRANYLNKINIFNIYDALYYTPRDYEDRRKLTKIISLEDSYKYFVLGNIVNFQENKINKGLTIYSYSVEDDTGVMEVAFFNQNYIKSYLKPGLKVAFYGKVENNFGKKQMKAPEFQIINNLDEIEAEILPVYPLTYGLSQQNLRKINKNILQHDIGYKEYLPNSFKNNYNILNLNKRLKGIHFPKSFFHQKRAESSLKYDEAFLFETAVLSSKKNFEENVKGYSKKFTGDISDQFKNNLEFTLTDSQKNCYEEIKNDMKKNKPMNRLLQGDVGSGKTIVSELSIIDNYESGYQSSIMVPTSVLAKQQFKKIKTHLEPLGITVEILLGETKAKEKAVIKEKLSNGDIDIIIGTHAIIQEDVEFRKLGFVVIDEQHRFGVNQRLNLISKGFSPDILVMTATPIPRTLALTLYGDLDVSTIREMPKGRKSIKTVLTTDGKSKKIYKFIEKELSKNNQAFFIYPLVEESEKVDLKNATDMYEGLKSIFSDYNIGLLHGKMKPEEKTEIMDKFANKEFHVLVSTTVVEVGVDIPDATVMVIEHPDRFGLSQLHQLRGRVGRSKKQAYCFLIVNGNLNQETKDRLLDFSNTLDGFEVSNIDLKWRGPGKFFGTLQHGLPDFKFLDLINDLEIIDKVKSDVDDLLESNLDLELIKKEIKRRYKDNLDLIKAF
ncbi:MAG: ATP-dependent DNA helicase RecG [Thermotogota bacterium]